MVSDTSSITKLYLSDSLTKLYMSMLALLLLLKKSMNEKVRVLSAVVRIPCCTYKHVSV